MSEGKHAFQVGDRVIVPNHENPNLYRYQGQQGAYSKRGQRGVVNALHAGSPHIVDVTWDIDGETYAWYEQDLEFELSDEDVDAAIQSIMRRT